MLEHFKTKSFADVTMTQNYLIAATFQAEFMFYELNGNNLIEVRKSWSLYESLQFDPMSRQAVTVRGMRSMLDSKHQETLAVQLSNKNMIIIDLFAQVYSTQKREDLKAKMDDFNKIEKETMTDDKIKKLSTLEVNKIMDTLGRDRISLMDIKFNYLSSGFHSGAIKEIHTCLQRPVVLTCSIEDQTIRLWNYLTSSCEVVH